MGGKYGAIEKKGNLNLSLIVFFKRIDQPFEVLLSCHEIENGVNLRGI
jgi:hypothetical protein